MTTTPTTAPSEDGSGAAAAATTADADGLRGVLTAGERPARPGAIAVCMVFGWRAMLKIKHVPEQMFDVTMFPIMFTLMFTYLFGGALAGSPADYAQYLIPGILVQTVTMISMYTGMGLNTDIQKGVFDRIRTLPIWQPGPVVGALLADLFRYAMAASIVLALGLAIGFRPEGGVPGVLVGMALVMTFSFAISWIWTTVALVMRTPESVMYMSMMVLFPLTFISSIFVDPETLPGWLQAFVAVNPVTHLADATRGLMAGDASVGKVTLVLAESAAIVAVFAPLTMLRYRRER